MGAGQVERVNGAVLERLSSLVIDERHWDRYLEKVRWSINNTTNISTGKTPNESFLGYRPKNREEAYLVHLVQMQKTKEKMLQLNIRNKNSRNYNVGELVVCKFEYPADGQS